MLVRSLAGHDDTTFTSRLRRTATSYASEANEDGGWGLFAGSDSSLVNTAEVLAILKATGWRPNSPAVDKGLAFICKRLRDDPRPRDAGGRGQRSRYVIFGLLGLTEFGSASWRPDIREAISTACDWLLERQTTTGSWPASLDATEGDVVLTTALAAIALERLRPGDEAIQRALDSLRSTPSVGFRRGRKEPFAPHQALAALALREAGALDDARAIASALAASPEAWCSLRHHEGHAGTRWQHSTFSLALRAVLDSGAADVEQLFVSTSVTHLRTLWHERTSRWLDEPSPSEYSATPSVRAAYGVTMAIESLVRALGARSLEAYGERPHPRRAHLKLTQAGPIELDLGDSIARIDVPWRQRELIEALIDLGATRDAPVDERKVERAMGSTSDALERNSRRLNQRVREHVADLSPLVRHREGRFWLDVDQASTEDTDLPPVG
jgi:hypothetical protein